ncbi:cytochrome c oxidase assembly protein COX18, mitochondrial isoform X4 [Petromyzon marinus]|uniref:cytochrome c oxidase assembly protein COX18, mitochondrial isoform X4 n=1 Tax=Petromyzon marinus TaxID=7757 RepID=UPI003F70B9A8
MGGHHRCVWGTVRVVARRASQFNNPAPRLLTLFPDHRHCSGRAFSVSAPSHAGPSLGAGGGLYSSLADTAPVLLAEHLLAATQASLGLPWWATITCSTIALRSCVTLPLTVYQMHVIAKLSALQQEIAELARLLRRDVSVTARQRGWPESTARVKQVWRPPGRRNVVVFQSHGTGHHVDSAYFSRPHKPAHCRDVCTAEEGHVAHAAVCYELHPTALISDGASRRSSPVGCEPVLGEFQRCGSGSEPGFAGSTSPFPPASATFPHGLRDTIQRPGSIIPLQDHG